MREDQAVAERAIFTAFARVSGLPIRLDSIESRPWPEPDIWCEVDGEGAVAFELGEVVNEEYAKHLMEGIGLDRRFRAAYESLDPGDRERIEASLGGPPAVLVGFAEGVPPGQWRRVIPIVVDLLVSRSSAVADEDRLVSGEFPAWRVSGLRSFVTDLHIQPCSMSRPHMAHLEMALKSDRTRALLSDKFSKEYRSVAPIELLVHFTSKPSPDEPEWREEILEFVQAYQPGSQFRRVWVFDAWGRKVILVYPGLA